MTPTEKANNLIEKYYQINKIFDFDYAKECALIAVEEILDFITKYDNHIKDYTYWQEVKQEIEKL